MNVVARGLDLGEGDEVVLAAPRVPLERPPLALAHPARRRRCASSSRTTRAARSPRGGSPRRSAARTRVVAFAHVSYLHGGRIDPGPVVDAARRFGAVTVVDGSQAAGALPFDFGASGVDVYAAAAYKFLLGPYGCRARPLLAARCSTGSRSAT